MSESSDSSSLGGVSVLLFESLDLGVWLTYPTWSSQPWWRCDVDFDVRKRRGVGKDVKC